MSAPNDYTEHVRHVVAQAPPLTAARAQLIWNALARPTQAVSNR